jgi:hypothetical protein
MTSMPCRSHTPHLKGKVERGVGYAKNNAHHGRQFASLGEQNAHLLHWEENVADKRLHGTTRQQVADVFEEERKALGALPVSLNESYQASRRRVNVQRQLSGGGQGLLRGPAGVHRRAGMGALGCAHGALAQ